jgi:hypothetical protein
MPMHCSGQNFIDLAKQEMPDKLMLCGTRRQLHLHGVNRRGRTAQEVIVGVTRMGLDRVDEVAGWAHAGRSASWSPRFSEADAVSDEPASWWVPDPVSVRRAQPVLRALLLAALVAE